MVGQIGFLDLSKGYAGLDAKSDPLAKLSVVAPCDDFRSRHDTAWRRPSKVRKSPAGRKPWVTVMIFRMTMLCELYNLSEELFEYQLRNRLSFMRFLGLGLEDPAPNASVHDSQALNRGLDGPRPGRTRVRRAER